MTYEEYKHSRMQNEIVWVCDYRFEDSILKKPRRHITPTKVMCDGNCNTSKKVLYSYYHFKRLNKEGKPIKSNIIVPYDGTGYRSYPGVSLQIFLNEEDCRAYYKKTVEEIIAKMKKEKEDILNYFEEMKSKLEKEVL